MACRILGSAAVIVVMMLLCISGSVWGMEVVVDPQGVDPFAAPEQEGEAVKAAAAAGLAWLELVDEGHYAASWDKASQLFQLAVPSEGWQRQLKATRAPMGKLVQRRQSSAQYTETLPGAPDSVYVVLQFSTQFSRKSSAVETLTLQLEKDGEWKVGGYYIR